MKSRVAFTARGSRHGNIAAGLDLIRDDIDLSGVSDLFIKVNFVSTTIHLAATHVDGVRALLEFLRERYTGKITIGEATRTPATDGFKRYGYMDLVPEFGVELVDLNHEDFEIIRLYDPGLRSMDIHYSKRILHCGYLVSIGPPKTHDSAIVTLSLKNIVMGAVSQNHGDRHKMHAGPPAMNLDLYLAAAKRLPDLSIIDGFTGMEGNGPENGDPVDWGIAVASADAVAADSLVSGLMGFPYTEVGYLWYLQAKGYGTGNPEDMEILGDDPAKYQKRFKPHPWYEWGKKWQDEKVSKIVGL
jgi:uncharacterized protein (DUF362 family)